MNPTDLLNSFLATFAHVSSGVPTADAEHGASSRFPEHAADAAAHGWESAWIDLGGEG